MKLIAEIMKFLFQIALKFFKKIFFFLKFFSRYIFFGSTDYYQIFDMSNAHIFFPSHHISLRGGEMGVKTSELLQELEFVGLVHFFSS